MAAGGCVLIVDDNPANLRLAQYLLTSSDFDVRTAASAEEALMALASVRPDLILMDLQLPGLDGLTLTRQLKDHPDLKDVAIVAMTAYVMRGDEARAREAGCDGYLAKPIDPETFVASVENYISSQQSD
jgi:CheY-like chemotaxis protein